MAEQKTIIRDMTSGNLWRQIIMFSLPFMAANFLQTLYTLADLAVVGKFVGSTALSAVSVSGQITMLLYALGIGFGNGGQILVSQQVGLKDYDGIRRTIGTLLTSVMIASLALTAVGFLTAGWFVDILNTPPEAAEEARTYFYICCVGIPFTYGYSVFASLLRGMGDSKHPFIFIAVAAATNVVLDLIFVIPFQWGVAGAAWATVISQIASFLMALIFLYKRQEAFHFQFKLKNFAIDKHTLAVITKLSLPLVFQTLAINISMMFVSSYINGYGLTASSVSGVGNKLYSVMSVVTNALQSATATIVGQNIAAGEPDRVQKAVIIAEVFCLIFFVVVGGLLFLFPRQVFSLFSSDAAVLDMAPTYINISLWMYLAFALMAPLLGLINGVGFTTLNLIVALLDGVLARIVVSLFMGLTLGMGLEGFWWGTTLASYISVIIPGIYFLSGRWRKRRLLVGQSA